MRTPLSIGPAISTSSWPPYRAFAPRSQASGRLSAFMRSKSVLAWGLSVMDTPYFRASNSSSASQTESGTTSLNAATLASTSAELRLPTNSALTAGWRSGY